MNVKVKNNGTKRTTIMPKDVFDNLIKNKKNKLKIVDEVPDPEPKDPDYFKKLKESQTSQ